MCFQLQEICPNIVYRKSHFNGNADAFSRIYRDTVGQAEWTEEDEFALEWFSDISTENPPP